VHKNPAWPFFRIRGEKTKEHKRTQKIRTERRVGLISKRQASPNLPSEFENEGGDMGPREQEKNSSQNAFLIAKKVRKKAKATAKKIGGFLRYPV